MLAIKFSAVKTYSRVVWQLVKTDMAGFRKNLVDNSIDIAIYVALIVGSMTYMMPLLGTRSDYGPFIAFAAIPSACIFETYGLAINLIGDIRGEKLISYRLTLPLPTALVFIAKGCVFSIRMALNAVVAALVSMSILAVGGRLSFAFFSPFKLLLMSGAMVICSGFLVLFISSLVKNMDRIGSVWTRTLYPLWFLGGAQFSWAIMHTFSPTIGIIALLDPFTYLTEGIHAATLNPADYLNFWLCLGMTLLFTIFFGFVGIKRLKKQLDWV